MTLVFVAICLPVLVIFCGLAIDTANWWVHKRHLQIQADAAAFAGASKYRFPVCDNAAIEQEAVRYSGGVDTDNASIAALHNFQRGANPDVATPIHVGINEPSFWNDSEVHDSDLVGEPSPCTTKFIDVKVTEEKAPGFFVRPFVGEIDAEARVSLLRLTTAAGLLPIGVEDVNPTRVHIWMYDEDTGALLGESELRKRDVPENGLYVWDNAPGNGDALPLHVDNVTSQRIGVKVALSGTNSVTCGQPLVLCYGYGAPIPGTNGTLATEGLPRIRGYDVTGTDPRLGEVALLTKTCTFNAALDNGYFARSCTEIDVVADLRGVTNTGGDAATVEAYVKVGNKENKATLTYDATLARWKGTLTVAQNVGPLPIGIRYEQKKGSLGNGTACTNKAPCTKDFADAHLHFAGSETTAGPIKELRVDTLAGLNVNNVKRCVGSATGCSEDFTIRLGVGGRLELSEPDDDPISLRVFGSGSQNQSLDCDPDEPSFVTEIAVGCGPSYTVKTDDTACPKPTTMWASPQPWNCVAVQTGTAANKPSQGLNQRILCSAPNEANCPQRDGKATSCTVPNGWPDYPQGDPRVLPVFLVPFGTFDSQGTESVPVIDFAFFYVTGWTGQGGGFANPCQNYAPDPDVYVPGTENDAGVLSGHFVKYIGPNTVGSGTEPCDLTTIGGCVTVMTK